MPRELIVEYRTVDRRCVDTRFSKLGDDTNPALWKKSVVDCKERVLTYPAEPRPVTVDVILEGVTPPGPKAVEKVDIA